jgi:CRP-like cAMP-binding protein
MKDTKEIIKFRSGQILAREGDIDDGWYILLKGTVGAFKKGMQVGTFENKGVIFGELSGILNHPRTATLMSLDNCEVIHVKATLDELVQKYPDITKKIMVNLAERLMKTTDDLWLNVHGKEMEAPEMADSSEEMKKVENAEPPVEPKKE